MRKIEFQKKYHWHKLSTPEKILLGLLSPEISSKHAIKENGLGDAKISFPIIGDEDISLMRVFDEKNFKKNTQPREDLLGLYFTYIQLNFLSGRERLFDQKLITRKDVFSHPAYNAASCVYIQHGELMNHFFRNFAEFEANLKMPKLTEIIVKSLDQLKLPEEKNQDYLIIVTGSDPWEVYLYQSTHVVASNPWQVQFQESSQKDEEKTRGEIKKIENTDVLSALKEIQEIGNVEESRKLSNIIGVIDKIRLAKYTQLDFPKQLSDKQIILITSAIILSYALSLNSKHDYLYRITSWRDCSPVYSQFNRSFKYFKELSFSSFSEKNFAYSSADLTGAGSEHVFIKIRPNSLNGKYIGSLSKDPSYQENEFIISPGTPLLLKKISAVENFHFYEAKLTTERYKYATSAVIETFFNYCKENYFSKPFSEMTFHAFSDIKSPTSAYEMSIGTQNVTVYKRKHGAVHSIRKMERLAMILEYCSVTSTDKNFQNFCNALRNEDKILIKFSETHQQIFPTQLIIDEISMVMGSTSLGRRSDSHEKEDLERYRKFTCYEFKKIFHYMTTKFPQFSNAGPRLESYLNVLYHLCDLDKMKELNYFDQYVMRIVFITHTLDLTRCYDRTGIVASLKSYVSPFVDAQGKIACEDLVDYSACQTQITCDFIEAKDHIVSAKKELNMFAIYSHDLISCQRALRGIPTICFDNYKFTEVMEEKHLNKFNYEMVKQLIGSKIPYQDKVNFPYLMSKMMEVIPDIRVLNAFAMILITGIERNIDQEYHENGDTPLMLAARSKKYDDKVVKILIDSKSDVNKKNTQSGTTPLIYAVQCQSVNKVMLLLQNKANIDFADNQKKTPLDYASGEMLSILTKS